MIFYILLYILIIFLLFYFKDSKKILIFALLYLLLLFTLNTDIADRSNYEIQLSLDISHPMELGWNRLLAIIRSANLPIQSLYVVVGIPYLITLFFFASKISENNRAIACYMIGIFFLDVAQLRFTFSTIFIWLAFYFFLSREDRFAYILYAFFVTIASLFHASNSIFFVFLLSKKQNPVKTSIISFITSVFFFLTQHLATAFIGQTYNIENKINRISAIDSAPSFLTVYVSVSYIISALLMIILSRYNYSSKDKKINIALNISILAFTIIPFLLFSTDFRRHIFIIDFLLICLFFKNEKKYNDKLLFVIPISIVLTFFIYSTFLGNRETVFFPIFENNMLINFIQTFTSFE